MTPLERGFAYAEKVPGAIEGQGGDKHTYALACKLVGEPFNLSGNAALEVLRRWNSKCQPPWREQELARKITCAGRPVSSAGAAYGFKKWPDADEKRIKQVVRGGITLARLEDLNPCRPDGDGPHSEWFIDALFPGNPLLCCATTARDFETHPREHWRGIESQQAYIVPSAMSARYGLTEDGKQSQRTKTNVGPRQYIVAEFDTGTADEQAAILFHLSKFAPLVLALHSGGKSLHGWFRCADVDPEKVTKFFRYCVSLGADDQQHCACQLVRMPDGTRENGRRQRVVFFNPKGALPE